MRSRSLLTIWAPLLAALGGCSTSGTYAGKLVDGLTAAPRAEVRVIARAEGADLTCAVREATTDAGGLFSIADTCKDAAYTLTLPDNTLYIPQAVQFTGGEAPGDPAEIKAWRAPPGAGIYLIADDVLTPLRTFSDVGTEKAWKGDEEVRYPLSKPVSSVPAVKSGTRLLISGKANIERLKFEPLIEDKGVRRFADGVTITDHVYLSARFKTRTAWETVDATVDASKTTDVTGEERQLRFHTHDALPEGRYGVLGESDNRLYILDFGG